MTNLPSFVKNVNYFLAAPWDFECGRCGAKVAEGEGFFLRAEEERESFFCGGCGRRLSGFYGDPSSVPPHDLGILGIRVLARDEEEAWKAFKLVQMGDMARLTALLDGNGSLVQSRDSEGRSLLHWATFQRKDDVAEMLLSRGAPVNGEDTQGNTPLRWTAFYGSGKVAGLLLDMGADVNQKDDEGRTPLHLAALNGHTEVARILVEHGADINAKNRFGQTALLQAERFGHGKTALYLKTMGAG
jgi:hypothetical protein